MVKKSLINTIKETIDDYRILKKFSEQQIILGEPPYFVTTEMFAAYLCFPVQVLHNYFKKI